MRRQIKKETDANETEYIESLDLLSHARRLMACGYIATAPHSASAKAPLARKRNAKTTEDGKSGDSVIAFGSREGAKKTVIFYFAP
ncbi:hypothetical protein J7355_06380 [Endozoicomonas sp. G2_2]|uniref:hypothetical protein n=1 Tax=Endozoicomonas sp. G2_2 TaxID=2821092 RepID=UPI001AD97BF9|nr:hypothetical protein [Endozoicomonas sp. G2_2]MBO9469720.1 hypothetical protein [Endozoicomonas sp. G2_2]